MFSDSGLSLLWGGAAWLSEVDNTVDLRQGLPTRKEYVFCSSYHKGFFGVFLKIAESAK